VEATVEPYVVTQYLEAVAHGEGRCAVAVSAVGLGARNFLRFLKLLLTTLPVRLSDCSPVSS
jgi:hypothetical protein